MGLSHLHYTRRQNLHFSHENCVNNLSVIWTRLSARVLHFFVSTVFRRLWLFTIQLKFNYHLRWIIFGMHCVRLIFFSSTRRWKWQKREFGRSDLLMENNGKGATVSKKTSKWSVLCQEPTLSTLCRPHSFSPSLCFAKSSHNSWGV